MLLYNSPINYMGNKFILLNDLIPLFDKTKQKFVDLFTGSGSVYMNIISIYNEIHINDIIPELIKIHGCFINKNKDFLNAAIKYSKKSLDKDYYSKLRDQFNNDRDPAKLLALIWSCNSNMMRFNKSFNFNQTHGKRCANKNTDRKIIDLMNLDLSNVTKLTSNHFSEIEVDSDCFVYLDPPYSNTGAGYNAYWNKDDDRKLIEYIYNLIKHKISFGMSGVLNEKENMIYNEFKDKLNCHFFGDMYQKISKKEKVNKEFYLTNVRNTP